MIWPGFVDAVTTLLMVMMFVLTIFTVMQSVLRDTITSQTDELDGLNAQLASLADALGLERQRADDLTAEVGSLSANLSAAQAEGERQSGLIATLTGQLSDRETELSKITEAEATRLVDAAALAALRDRLKSSDTELTAMTLALEEQRKRAEETLTLLAAAPAGTQAWFYRTAVGAEIDLVLEIPPKGRWAIEIKRSSAPVLAKGFYLGCDDIKATRRIVVHAGEDSYGLGDGIEAVSLPAALATLRECSE